MSLDSPSDLELEHETAVSLYEDALDESDVELSRVCLDALQHMNREQMRRFRYVGWEVEYGYLPHLTSAYDFPVDRRLQWITN